MFLIPDHFIFLLAVVQKYSLPLPSLNRIQRDFGASRDKTVLKQAQIVEQYVRLCYNRGLLMKANTIASK